MKKLEATIRLTTIMVELDTLMWDIIEEIGDLEQEEHELQPTLSTITDMMLRYDRDVNIEG